MMQAVKVRHISCSGRRVEEITEWVYPRWSEVWFIGRGDPCPPISNAESWFLDFVKAVSHILDTANSMNNTD